MRWRVGDKKHACTSNPPPSLISWPLLPSPPLPSFVRDSCPLENISLRPPQTLARFMRRRLMSVLLIFPSKLLPVTSVASPA